MGTPSPKTNVSSTLLRASSQPVTAAKTELRLRLLTVAGPRTLQFHWPSAPTRGAWSRAHLQETSSWKGPGHDYPRYLGNSFSLSTSWWCLKETAKPFGKQHVGGTSHRTCDLRSRSKQRRDSFEGHVHGGHCIVPPMYPPLAHSARDDHHLLAPLFKFTPLRSVHHHNLAVKPRPPARGERIILLFLYKAAELKRFRSHPLRMYTVSIQRWVGGRSSKLRAESLLTKMATARLFTLSLPPTETC